MSSSLVRWLTLLFACFVIGGCAMLEGQQTASKPVSFTPRQSNHQLEVAIAKLSDVLLAPDLTNEQRAKILYDRGVRYDSVGLRMLARIDFSRTLQLKPDLADAYNFMGIYYTQAQEYDRAYEAFSAVLELDPDYDYAFLNRGIAEYYGGRISLAAEDLETFYLKDKTDPYRVIWLYLAERRLDAELAQARLAYNRTQLNPEQWSTQLADVFLGKTDADTLIDSASVGLDREEEVLERLCEAYFYLAKHSQMSGDDASALDYFRLALATNVYEFVEHRYALLEVNKLIEAESTPQT